MTLHMDWNRDPLFQPTHQLITIIRREQPGHILNSDAVGTHTLKLGCHIKPTLDRVYWAHGVTQGALGVFFLFAHGCDSSLKITRVVHGIEDSEYIYSVNGGALDKLVHDVICVVPVP